MSMRFLVRGTTALACAALAATAVVPSAQAAVQTSFPTSVHASLQGLAPAGSAFARVMPSSPDMPSAEDIARAKSSESATAAQAAEIEAILNASLDRLQRTAVLSMGANTRYTDALMMLDQRKTAAEVARAKAAAAARDYKSAKSELGRLAGSLYKSGGLNPSLQSLLGSSTTDDTLYQASALMALTASRSRTLDSAAAAAATSAALQQQAAAAQKAADQAAAAATDSKTEAQDAAATQAAVVKDNAAQRGVLVQQLATLHNTTVALEGARVDALAEKARQESLRAQIAASNRAPAPVPPRPAPTTTAQQPPAATPPAPPVVRPTPPPAQAPQPPAPKPQPPVAPPAPPAPVQPAGSHIQVMVNFAMAQRGKPYAWGGNGPNSYDCSGLVQQAFAAAGVSVPRTGTAQFWAAPQRVPLSQMRYGDLLVFDSDGHGNFGHIAIYIGNGQVVQALYYGTPLGVTPLANMSGMNLYPYAARY